MPLVCKHLPHHSEHSPLLYVSLEPKHFSSRLGIEDRRLLAFRSLSTSGPTPRSVRQRVKRPTTNIGLRRLPCPLFQLAEGLLDLCAHLLLHVLLELLVIRLERRRSLLLLLDGADVLVPQLAHHEAPHEPIVVFQDTQLAGSDIQFVDQLAALLGDLCVHQLVDVVQELLTLTAEVEGLLLFHVEQVLVLVFADVLGLDAGAELRFAVLEEALAEGVEALVEIVE